MFFNAQEKVPNETQLKQLVSMCTEAKSTLSHIVEGLLYRYNDWPKRSVLTESEDFVLCTGTQ